MIGQSDIRMNKMKGIEEATMTPAQKRKDTMLKKKYDKSDMKKSMQETVW